MALKVEKYERREQQSDIKKVQIILNGHDGSSRFVIKFQNSLFCVTIIWLRGQKCKDLFSKNERFFQWKGIFFYFAGWEMGLVHEGIEDRH